MVDLEIKTQVSYSKRLTHFCPQTPQSKPKQGEEWWLALGPRGFNSLDVTGQVKTEETYLGEGKGVWRSRRVGQSLETRTLVLQTGD